MITSIECDLTSFKNVQFHRGINVLLADKSPESSDKQTRNSAGKTSLIEIIHFLLGANAGKESLARNPALLGSTFRGTFAFDDGPLTVARSGSEPSRILISQDSAERFGLVTRKDKTTGNIFVSNETWKEFLGHKMFGLPAQIKGSAFEEANAPSFRALLAYFARRRGSGAFMRPEKHSELQQRSDWQVNLSYLLGLDWRIPCELHSVREREKQLEELKKAAKSGAIGQVIGTVAELRPKLVLAEAEAERLRTNLANFQVVDSYREYSDRAARARAEMLTIERRAVALKDRAVHLRNALDNERPPEISELPRIYEAVGVELPGVVRRRFEEVASFHQSVIENRRAHLQEEIADIERQIAEGDRVAGNLSSERSNILHFLNGRGALEDFVALQKTLADREAEAASLRQRYQTAGILEGEATQLEIDRANIKRRLQEDHQARKSKLDEAILIIGRAISELYEDRTGEFVVDATDNGPEFGITIQGDRGAGISNMEIFCLDLALFLLTRQNGRGPGFLIHDSHLFDGVDERQIAHALRLGGEAADRVGGQYIVIMNSDIFDRLPLPAEMDRQQIVVSTRLSDETEAGGLFGLRFD